MLKPRFVVARPLLAAVSLGLMATMGVWGCQGPDTFIRKGTGGSGAAGRGAGGSFFGAGGSGFGAGGSFGSGGFFGSGGSSFGSGGSQGQGGSGTGGRAGAGGSSVGGTTGAGGARDGGNDATGAGGAIIVDSGSDSEGGIVDGPCMGLCAPAVTYSQPPNFGSPQFLASQSACYQTLSAVHGGGCSNCGGRINSINGVSVPVTGWPSTLPAPVRGGYCIQISVGQPDGGAVDYASFYTF